MAGLSRYRLTLIKEEEVGYIGCAGSPSDVFEMMKKLGFTELPEEHLWLLTLNTKNEVVGLHEISHGSVNLTMVDLPSIFKRVLLSNSIRFILVHNHPSGDCTPSERDYKVSRKVADACKIMGMELLDHLVISEEGFQTAR